MEAFKRVEAARAKGRPTGYDFISNILTGFLQLHGDRRFGDDQAVVAGIGWLNDLAVTAIAIDRGKDTKEKVARNFGSAHPEGYRKALRQMKLAENLMEMMALKVPVITILTGEGGSGGALGLAVADEVWMLENAVYSVISPEGCASILWKDASRTSQAAECLKLTAQELLELGVVERVLKEPKDPQKGFDKVYQRIGRDLYSAFQQGLRLSGEELSRRRYQRFRRMGAFLEEENESF